MIDRRLQYVVATARFGSFTAAAERMGVTQSAITKGVKDLESELGYTIFNRTTRGVIVTEAGRDFVERAARLQKDAQGLMRGSAAGPATSVEILRIGVCPASLEVMLMEPLATLVMRHPNVRLDIVGGSFDKIVQQLRSGAIDVAFGYQQAFLEQPDFRLETLASLQSTLFMRLGHPLLDLPEITTADVARYPIISPSGSSSQDYAWKKIYEDSGVDADEYLHTIDCFPIVERLVSITDAISTVATQYTHSRRFKTRFAVMPGLGPLMKSPLCCATRLRWSPRPMVRAFIKTCREELKFSGEQQAG